MKFKVGDKARIIHKSDDFGSHMFNLGEIVTITGVFEDEYAIDTFYKADNVDNEFWYVDEAEIELLEDEE